MRVAVLGAGYAGLTVARRLERRLPDDVELVVVDESEDHLVQHELHRVVRFPDLAETITVPLSEVLSRADLRQARVTDVDAEAGVATLSPVDGAGTEELDYDAAAVCLGAETAFYDLPGVEEHATPLKRLPHAEAIRADAMAAPGGDAVVGGAGLSGVQVAGELAELSAAEDLDLGVTVLEMADRIAPGFDGTFAGAIREELEAREVAVETGATVESADDEAVTLGDGRTFPHDVFVWAGGIRGPAALDGERQRTGGDLRVGEATFVVGDAAAVVDEAGAEVPASAQTAVREARTAASNLLRVVNAARVTDETDEDPRFDAYRYEEAGWVVSVGNGAVAEVGPAVVSGDLAKAVKAVIGAGHLGSVGAIEEATDLVREELGWPGAEAFDFSPLAAHLEGYVATDATDPSSLGEFERRFVGPLLGLSELGATEPVDLTDLTRATDRDHPGSPANLLFRTLFGPAEAAADFETVTISTKADDADETEE
ncbi:NAD(P)/FAD-dependent oxidoreductase [Natronomonas marina]|jgi:NADH dehydrogenase|uniref:NAD(P)/FAD-dependent oxidoreductase n=1 Tax=Natronomonas marina TaxID=2961939 RepID=UPI0033133995